MVGALPPFKGNAYYSMSLARHMARKIGVEFLAFRKLYPEFLYPGGVSDQDPHFLVTETDKLKIRRILHYANPWSWIRGGLMIKARVVHLQWWSIPLGPAYFFLLCILKLRRKRIVITVHNVNPHESAWFNRAVTKAIVVFADGLIVHSDDNENALVSQFNVPREDIYKIAMPVHDMYGGYGKSKTISRGELGIPQEAQVILSFGNLREYKGIDILLKAFAHLRGVCPRAHLLIVGQKWGGWSECEKLIDDLGIMKKVTLVLDYVPMSAVPRYFVSSDVVVLPYRWFDAQSGVGNIALFYGLPLVVSRVGGLPELVIDDRVVVEPDDPDLLADCLTEVLGNKEFYDKLCEDSQVLKKKYSWGKAVDNTLEVYAAMERKSE